MDIKVCPTCDRKLSVSAFYARLKACRECVCAARKVSYKKRRRAILAQKLKYQAAHAESIAAYQKKRYAQNRDRKIKMCIEYARRRVKVDLIFRLTLNLRSRFSQAFRRGYKTGSAIRDLGCSIEDLKKHLESQFQPGMTWENWGRRGWHIDHVKPLASFDLTSPEAVKQACHFTNLQPLWARDNIKKGAR